MQTSANPFLNEELITVLHVQLFPDDFAQGAGKKGEQIQSVRRSIVYKRRIQKGDVRLAIRSELVPRIVPSDVLPDGVSFFGRLPILFLSSRLHLGSSALGKNNVDALPVFVRATSVDVGRCAETVAAWMMEEDPRCWMKFRGQGRERRTYWRGWIDDWRNPI